MSATNDDLLDALAAVGAELIAREDCRHQGVLIRWQRRARTGETFLGLQLADPTVGEVVEYHYVPFDQVPVSDEVMRVTVDRAIQRAVWALEYDARKLAALETTA